MATRSMGPGAVVAASGKTGAREWPDMISNYQPLEELQAEWKRFILRPSVSESDRERASLLWRCLEQRKRQLHDVQILIDGNSAAIRAAFNACHNQTNAANKKEVPRTETEKSYLESAIGIMQPPAAIAVAPLSRMGSRAPTLFPFKNEWPGQIHNYQKLDTLARQWERFYELTDQAMTSEDEIKYNGMRSDRYRWKKQLADVEAILASNTERQYRSWDSFRIGRLGSNFGGIGKQPASFDEYLDSLQFQKWHIEQALVLMDVEVIDGKIAEARASSSSGRSSLSSCTIM